MAYGVDCRRVILTTTFRVVTAVEAAATSMNEDVCVSVLVSAIRVSTEKNENTHIIGIFRPEYLTIPYPGPDISRSYNNIPGGLATAENQNY